MTQMRHVLVKSVIEKRSFKYADIWQGIISDINLLVRAKYNNRYYHLGDIDFLVSWIAFHVHLRLKRSLQ